MAASRKLQLLPLTRSIELYISIIYRNYNDLHSTIFQLSQKHTIATHTHPEFIYTKANYLTGYPDPDGIKIEYVFFIGEPMSGTQESTASLIKSVVPQSEIVVLDIQFSEEGLLSVMEEKLGVRGSEEGQYKRRLQ